MNGAIVYIISDVHHSKYFEWLASSWSEHISSPLEIILINGENGRLHQHLNEVGIPVHIVNVSSRWSWRGMKTIKELLLTIRPGVVHTHLLTASILGLVAAKRAGIQSRIHTRHHSTFHHDYHPRWVRVDRWLSSLSKHIVAISNVVQRVLVDRENVDSSKVIRIPHGFQLDWFAATQGDCQSMRQSWMVGDRTVIGVVSRMMELKGIRCIVEGFQAYLVNNPNAVLVFMGTAGSDKEELIGFIRRQLKPEQYRLLDHVDRMNVAYRCCNCIVHVPITPEVEAFGQIYVEAMASEVPLICTVSGIAHELIDGGKNAVVVDYNSGKEIGLALEKVMTDEGLRDRLITNGTRTIQSYNFQAHMGKLKELYV